VCDMSLRVLLEGLVDWHYELRQLAQASPEVRGWLERVLCGGVGSVEAVAQTYQPRSKVPHMCLPYGHLLPHPVSPSFHLSTSTLRSPPPAPPRAGEV
jgi:hypothetical protein